MIKKVLALVDRFANYVQWLPAVVSRLTMGSVFATSGWGKLHNLPKVIAFFTQLGIPAPQIQAPFVATMEFVCGCLVLLGLATRAAAIPLVIIMLVALKTAKAPDIAGFDDLTGVSEYLYIVILLWLLVMGAGGLSLDRIVRKKLK